EHCLARLDARDRDLILAYYAGGSEERITRRRDLARRLELTLNALTIRASRLRERLRASLIERARGLTCLYSFRLIKDEMALPRNPPDDVLVRYLLGALPPGDQEALDELSIVDGTMAERLRAIEDD